MSTPINLAGALVRLRYAEMRAGIVTAEQVRADIEATYDAEDVRTLRLWALGYLEGLLLADSVSARFDQNVYDAVNRAEGFLDATGEAGY